MRGQQNAGQGFYPPDLLPSLLIFLLLASIGCAITGPEDFTYGTPEPGQVRVLFVGSSYFAVNDMPGIFKGLALAGGKDVFVGRRVQSGYYLDFFSQDGATFRAIQDQEWDYVILSGGCQTIAYPDTHGDILQSSGHHPVYPALAALKQTIQENNPATEMIYMMPWAFEDGMTWVTGQTDTYADMQLKIRDNALLWANSLDFGVAPVGMAWHEVMEGEPPLHFLYQADYNHPSRRGSYLSAATIYATIFQESVEGVDYPWLVSPQEADTFQTVGSRTVLDSLSLWNLEAISRS